jgi:FkbM family methyltransferase
MFKDIYNREYARNEFKVSGEEQLMRGLSGKLNTILDCGSNIGEWARMAREFNPNSDIHTFEVVSDIYRILLKNLELDDKIIPNGFGLSDYNGILKMKYCPNFKAVSTYLEKLRVDNFEWRDGLVMKGDDYCSSHRIDYIDFLKIDTEGAEKMVLDGFKRMLDEHRIGIIQFEYGYANILSKFLLVDAYELLSPYGFHIGKLLPDGIEFHDYNLLREDFKGPNYVAVHHSKTNFLEHKF